jgi:hypothetical protein
MTIPNRFLFLFNQVMNDPKKKAKNINFVNNRNHYYYYYYKNRYHQYIHRLSLYFSHFIIQTKNKKKTKGKERYCVQIKYQFQFLLN